MNRRFPLILVFGALLILLIADGVLYFQNTQRLLEHQRWMLRTQQELITLEQTLLTLVDAETGQRGYLLTRDETYLEPYHGAMANLDSQIARLSALAAGEPHQQERIAELLRLIARRRAVLEQTVALAQDGEYEAAQHIVRTGRGKRDMDALRTQIALMREEVQQQLGQRAAAAQVDIRQTTWAFFAALGVAIVLLTLVYLGSARAISRREKAAAAQARYIQRIQALEQVNQAILERRSLDETAALALRLLAALLPCQGGVLAHFASGKLMRLADYHRVDTDLPEGFDTALSQALQREQFWHGEAVILPMSSRAAPAAPACGLASESVSGRTILLAIPLTIHEESIGCVALGVRHEGHLGTDYLQVAEEITKRLAVALHQSRLQSDLQASHDRSQALSQRLLEIQEAERAHLARELHDEVGQLLTGLNIMLEAGANTPANQLRQRMGEAQQISLGLTARVRRLSLDLRPPMLDSMGLLLTLRWHIDRYREQTGIAVQLQQRDVARRFDPDLEMAVYRIVQEALTNVARHANTSEVTVRLWADDDTLSVQIEDRGHGFDLEATQAQYNSSGLPGMYERAALAGGTLNVTSSPGTGTQVSAEFPLAEAVGQPLLEATL